MPPADSPSFRWSAWTSVRVRGKSLATLEAALAGSEERCQELRAQLKQMQDEKDAANQVSTRRHLAGSYRALLMQ